MKQERNPGIGVAGRARLALGLALAMGTILSGALDARAQEGESPSAILFIADGMGMAQVTAGRIYKGNVAETKLALDSMPEVGMVRTWSQGQIVTDSAAAATAMATGHKTLNTRISMDAEKRDLPTLLEAAHEAGMATGVVSTTRITHATPACFYGHEVVRYGEEDLAAELIDDAMVDVALGGGSKYFLPKGAGEGAQSGVRKDGRDLIAEAERKGYRLLKTAGDLSELTSELEGEEDAPRVLGLFNADHLSYELERPRGSDGEPSLAELTALAIEILSRDPDGYFLMVEGGRIDHACHDNQAQLAMGDTVAFDDAVGVALEMAPDHGEPLIVATADHETGGLAINGYPSSDLHGEGLVTKPLMRDQDILTFATGPGADRPAGADRADLQYRQPSVFKSSSAAHTGVDVGVWSAGPGAEAFRGSMDNTEIAIKIGEHLGMEFPKPPVQAKGSLPKFDEATGEPVEETTGETAGAAM